MAEGVTTYSSTNSAFQVGRLSKQMLRVAVPKVNLEDAVTVNEQQPEGETNIVRWSRWKSLPISTSTVVEGVTPPATQFEREEVVATLDQYMGLAKTTDVLLYFHPDFKINTGTKRLAEQAGTTVETLRFNTFKAATNKYYANGSARTDVNTAVSLGLLRKAENALDNQIAETFTEMVGSTPDFNTESILPAYWGFIHPNMKYDIEAVPGFKSVVDYGHNIKLAPNEWGSIGNIRFRLSTVYAAYPDAGGAYGGTKLSTSGTSADVYPIMIVGRDAFGSVSFRGEKAIQPFVVAPTHNAADPGAQRGYIGWKTFRKDVILNDAWVVILEVAVNSL